MWIYIRKKVNEHTPIDEPRHLWFNITDMHMDETGFAFHDVHGTYFYMHWDEIEALTPLNEENVRFFISHYASEYLKEGGESHDEDKPF